jgi:hypothetical protein
MQRTPRRLRGAPGVSAGALLLALVMAGCSGQPREQASWPAAGPSTIAAAPAPAQGQTPAPGAVAEPTTTTAPPAGGGPGAGAAPLILAPDGLSNARFGAAPDAVIAAVSGRLGAPSADTGWKPRGEVFGVCPGKRTRAVTWGGQFSVLFSDGPTRFGRAGREHFFLWSVEGTTRQTPVVTAAGVGLGSTLAEVREAYPASRVRTWEPETPGGLPGFSVGPEERPTLAGLLTDRRVSHLEAGVYCGE